MLSSTCKYGIRALIYLSLQDNEKLVNIKEIAKALDIPEPFLGKIMQNLVKFKILNSQRGINGGFKFKKSPSKVSFLDVIEIFDGQGVFNDCVLGMRICKESPEHSDDCPFRIQLDPLIEKFYKIFKETTISDFSDKITGFKDTILI